VTDAEFRDAERKWRKTLNWIVHRYMTQARELDLDRRDMYNTALVGLWRALEEYDPTRGTTLNTYVTSRVRWACGRRLLKERPMMRHIQERGALCRRVSARFAVERGREPTVEELAELSGETVAHVEDWLGQEHVSRMRSLQEPLSRDGLGGYTRLGDTIPASEPGRPVVSREAAAVLLKRLMACLTKCERRVVKMYFLQDKTGAEIARALGLHPTTVIHIRRRAMARLRERAIEECVEVDGLEMKPEDRSLWSTYNARRSVRARDKTASRAARANGGIDAKQ